MDITANKLRLTTGTQSAITKRNSTKVINALQILNLTELDY